MQGQKDFLEKFCKALRYWTLVSTSKAGSGHPTSCLSAVEIAGVLFAGGFFKYDLENPKNPLNDRFIISTGHKAPLLYALWAFSGAFEREKLLSLRQIDSPFEGHPTFRFPLSEVATGSLGQGLSIGAGIAEGIKLKVKSLKFKIERMPEVFVLLGDSELAEGQVWEAFQWAGYRKISNLIALIDVNRLGQRGETMWDWDLEGLKKRIEAFDWEVFVVEDGNDIEQVSNIYKSLFSVQPRRLYGERPKAIIFKTVKGKGVSFLEDKEGWHGKALPPELLEKALKELGEVDKDIETSLPKPENVGFEKENLRVSATPVIKINSPAATREAYGKALSFLFEAGAKDLVVLDAEVSNSTYAKDFAQKHPEHFFEMFIAEQNMASVALGLERMGFTPFISSFAAFLTRAFDQIRMAQYSKANLKIVGSHAGVSIGQDGASQMGLEDISMMRSILDSVVLYPSDYVSAFKLVQLAYKTPGIVYLRLTRAKTPIIYSPEEEFEIGGYKIFGEREKFDVVLIGAGITFHNSLKAAEELKKFGIKAKVIDLYCIKPISEDLEKEFKGAKFSLVVEDHYPYGGIFEAVKSVSSFDRIYSLAVSKIPRSGKPEEVMDYEEISVRRIVEKVRELMKVTSDHSGKILNPKS